MTNDARQSLETVTYLSTLQFSWGGLLNAVPADERIHLIRGTKHGTPGPTLCDIDRFAEDAPGWSVGGGLSGPKIRLVACPGCVERARAEFADLPIDGCQPFSGVVRAALA